RLCRELADALRGRGSRVRRGDGENVVGRDGSPNALQCELTHRLDLARPPALRITCASPSARPAYFAGSRRASMQVRIANPRAGGSAKSFLAPKPEAYFLLAATTSSTILDMGVVSLVV